jgi:signal peptidase II
VSAGRTILRTVLVAVAVVVADQVSKAIVRASLDPFERVKVIPGVHLVRAQNSGVAFSVFSSGGPLVVIVAVLALGALLAFFAPTCTGG